MDNPANTIDGQRSLYPLAVFNYRVSVNDEIMPFVDVSGLVRSYETLTYQHGLSFREGEQIVRFAIDTYSEVTLTKGLIPGNALTIYNWLKSSDIVPLKVDLCDDEGDAVVSWKIENSIVTSLEAPTLDVNENDVVIETITLMASGIRVEKVG